MGDGDGEPTSVQVIELSAEDKSRKGVFLDVLHDLGVDDMPDRMVDQLTVLARPQLHARKNGLPNSASENGNVIFKDTHLGDDLSQIAAFQASKEEITRAVFAGQESLTVVFDGENFDITPQSLEQDIKYMIFSSDNGKAGEGPESRDVVSRLYNDLNMGKTHMQWMREHPEKFDEFVNDEGITADPKTMETYRTAFNGGYFMDIPLSVAVRMSLAVAEGDESTKEIASRLRLGSDNKEVLRKIDIDPDSITTRTFFDKHVEFGEKFVDSLGLEAADQKRMLMLFHLGLTHHYSDYMPESYKNRRLKLEGNAINLSVIQVLLDKIDGHAIRGGRTGEDLKKKVLENIEKGRMVKDNGDEGQQILDRFVRISDHLEWSKVEATLRRGYRKAGTEAGKSIERSETESGRQAHVQGLSGFPATGTA